MGEKIYIIDTSALIENPGIISKLKGKIFLPEKVMRELDGLKKSADKNVNYNARKASQDIEKNINRIKIAPPYEKVTLLTSEADNQVIGTAIHAKKQGLEPLVLSTDRNIRIAVKEKGIEAMPVDGDKKNDSQKTSPLFNYLWTAWAIIITVFAWISAVLNVPHEMGSTREFIPFVVGFLMLWIERIFAFIMITAFLFLVFALGAMLIGLILAPFKRKKKIEIENENENNEENKKFYSQTEDLKELDDISAGLAGAGPYSCLSTSRDFFESYRNDDCWERSSFDD